MANIKVADWLKSTLLDLTTKVTPCLAKLRKRSTCTITRTVVSEIMDLAQANNGVIRVVAVQSNAAAPVAQAAAQAITQNAGTTAIMESLGVPASTLGAAGLAGFSLPARYLKLKTMTGFMILVLLLAAAGVTTNSEDKASCPTDLKDWVSGRL
jgi:hypothetical protein